jgi:EAL domain-containing protein (putative c-di-GMP-specific phosphodiesterase class I)
VAVNISSVQLESPDFVEGVFKILEATGLNPASLELELTESVLMKNPERTKAVLKALKEKGVQVSVDNYGTGDTSLASLRDLSLDAIKIDGIFVRRIATDPYEETKVSAMINMGQSLDMRVIAEGVETAGNLEFLWEHGCDQAQGYFFGQPAPAEQL